MPQRLLIILAIFVFITQPAFADEETELLRQQIKQLEARLAAIEKKQAQQPVVVSATPAPAQTSVEYGNGKGLAITSPDKNFQLKISGYVQADDHEFLNNSAPASNGDKFYIRSARPILEAKFYNDFNARLMWDFGNGQSSLLDAYLDYKPYDEFNTRVGKFKVPIGIERWQSEQNILFVERGLTTNLVPYRDNGVEFYGNLIPKNLEYQIAITNGAADLANDNGGNGGDAVTARVFANLPYGIGLGFAGSYGVHNENLNTPDLTAGYVTPAQSKFFAYSATSFANGEQWRFNPQATYYNDSFSFISEYIIEGQKIQSGNVEASLDNKAWEAIATYVLTGEDARFDGVIPRNNFDPKQSNWGAFELVGRVGELRIDKAAFPTFASLATSAKSAQEGSFGGTWYMNPRLNLI